MKFLDALEYQPIAALIFEAIKDKLSETLPIARIEHIGSSAIQGAISKGDLDIFVGVSKDLFQQSIKTIEDLGFTVKSDTLRTESLCMLQMNEGVLDTAVQLVETGSEFENLLLFRDRLNAEPRLVELYNALKTLSIDLDPAQYRQRKSDFISKVLNREI